MTNLQIQSIGNLMFADKNGSSKNDYPYIKFYDGDKTKIEIIKITNNGGERNKEVIPVEQFKARILLKTTVYEHAFADDDTYKPLGRSSEFLEKKTGVDLDPKFYTKPFFFVDLENKTLQEDLQKQQDIQITLGQKEMLKRKDVLYVDVEGYGICKIFLKLTQTIGKRKIGENYEFCRKEPIENGIEHILQTYGPNVFNYVFTVKANSYKSAKTSTTTYPVFLDPSEELNPEVSDKQLEIFEKFYNENQELYKRHNNQTTTQNFVRSDGELVEELPF